MHHPRSAGRSLLLLLCATASCGSPRSGEITDRSLGPTDTIVTASSTALARPTELIAGPDGPLVVTDYAAHAIVMLDSTGTLLATIGRPGAGPGELNRPRGTRLLGDSLRVLDEGNGRVAVFTADGRFVRVEPMPPGASAGAISFCPDGGMVLSLNGRDHTLAERTHIDSSPSSRLGAPVAPAPEVWDFTAIKREIFEGRVPAMLRNIVTPVCGTDGTWLLLLAEARVDRYSRGDSLRWQATLTEPEFSRIKAGFFEGNRRDSAGFRFTFLSYFAHAQEVGSSLWVLLSPTEDQPTTILVINHTGAVEHRFRVPGTRGIHGFAVDEAHHWLYLLSTEDSTILRLRIPKVLGGAA